MADWTVDELHKFAAIKEMHVAPLRDDAVTYFKPIPIWAVALDGMLYVRAYYGAKSRWYQAALRQKAGRISAAGTTKNVVFEPAGGTLDDRIDEAYRAKYGSSSYLAPMLGEDVRTTTLRITPRD